jgi:tetratricopeptide (TPR) repeat protein
MKINLFLKPFLWVTVILVVGHLRAQSINSNSAEAFPILNSGIGSRAIGMGGSFSAVADDFSAVYYNPAGLGQVWEPQLFLNHEGYLGSGFYETAGFINPLKEGTLALGLSYINYGSIDLRDSNGNLEGNYVPFDMDARGSFGFSLTNNLYFGLGSEWARQQITNYVYTALLWNFGFLLKPTSSLSIGLGFQNFGIENLSYSLPAVLTGGVAYQLHLDSKGTQSLILAAGGDFSFESDNYLNAGFEYAFLHNYFVRAGYDYDLQDQSLGEEKGLSFGAGVKIDQFKLDYSFTFDGSLGNVQTVALTTYFPPFKKPIPESKATAAPVTVFLPGLPVVVKVVETPTATPIAATRTGNVNAGVLNPTDKNPVMLKFQITSQNDLSAAELYNQAEDKLKLGLNKEAEELYLKVLDKDPNFDKAWYRLGRIYFDESLNSYRHVLQLEPQNLQLRQWLQQFNGQ